MIVGGWSIRRRSPNRHRSNYTVSAIRAGQTAQIRRSIAADAVDVTAPLAARTPLTLAAECGATELVRVLLRAGARLDACDEYGQTACHAAIRFGQLDTMRLLLAHGASVAVTVADVNDHYPLFTVLFSMAPDVADLAIELIDAGAEQN
jgi:hypothetical protein